MPHPVTTKKIHGTCVVHGQLCRTVNGIILDAKPGVQPDPAAAALVDFCAAHPVTEEEEIEHGL